MKIRIQIGASVVQECSCVATIAGTVGSLMGAACLVGAFVAFLTSMR